VLSRGRLLQIGSPEELYETPSCRTVAEFVGRATLIPVVERGEDTAAIIVGGVERIVRVVRPAGVKGPLLAVLRPEALGFATDGWPGVVHSRRFAGSSYHYRVRLDGGVEVEVAVVERSADEGDRVAVRVVREPIPVVATGNAD
jgi:ABC-type Fe3+/spermidine/putrescine transport system ATPase subunit